jgi:hypothetical protein
MGVSSGFSEGNARTVPLARRRTTAVENNKSVLLIPISFFISGAEEDKMNTPTRYPTTGNNRLFLPIGTSARQHIFRNATSQTTSENVAFKNTA